MAAMAMPWPDEWQEVERLGARRVFMLVSRSLNENTDEIAQIREALANLADLFARRDQLIDAVRLAAFVTHHADVVPDAREVAESVLTAVAPRLPTDQFQQAQVNGRAADFTDFLLQLP